jgi:hypothetical protein
MSDSVNDSGNRFHATDEADVVSYQAVSKLAIVSATLGVTSFAAILHPLMLAMTVVAIVTGVLALRAIATSTAGLTGRWLAVAGVTLGVFFASAAVGRLMSRDGVITARARKFADGWLRLAAQGRREEAYEMTLAPPRRQLPGTRTSLREYYENSPEANQRLQQFFDNSPARELVEFGAEGTLRFERIIDAVSDPRLGDLVGMVYGLDYVEGDEAKIARIHLVVRRSRHRKTGRGQWTVRRVEDPAVLDKE